MSSRLLAAVSLVSLVAGAAACDSLKARLSGRGDQSGETPASPSGGGETPAPPPSGTPSVGAAGGGPVTPQTQAPNEARALSAALAAVAKAMRPSVVRIDVEVQRPQVADRDDDGNLAPFLRRFFQFGQGAPQPAPQR